jgi:quercetin 2,3-dioxygenase
MITLRRSAERGHFNYGWLDTWHTFSFGSYQDPRHMGFRSLRVINEDFVAGGRGFDEHPHRDMEIITYVVSGRLAHKDSTGGRGEIGPGVVQWMSAGRGVRHSEFNASESETVHLLQIWVLPDRRGHEPAYQEARIDEAQRRDGLALLASGGGEPGVLPVRQDVRLYAAKPSAGQRLRVDLAEGRHAWVQVIRGGLEVLGESLVAGDGAAISGERVVELAAREEGEVLVFDLG